MNSSRPSQLSPLGRLRIILACFVIPSYVDRLVVWLKVVSPLKHFRTVAELNILVVGLSHDFSDWTLTALSSLQFQATLFLSPILSPCDPHTRQIQNDGIFVGVAGAA